VNNHRDNGMVHGGLLIYLDSIVKMHRDGVLVVGMHFGLAILEMCIHISSEMLWIRQNDDRYLCTTSAHISI
jgi:hypothetical protein